MDSEGPTCGNIVNSPKIADLDVWVGKYNKRNSRTVTVSCIDSKNGSGCVRKSFSKTWPNDEKDSFGKKIYKFGAETSTITISDNAGEKTICPVVVNVDVLSPSISLSAKVNDGTTNEKEVYKLSDIGGYKDNGDKYVENPFTKVIEANDYDQSVLPKRNDNNIWINSTYSSGITYTIKVDDNFYLKSWEWKTNKKNIISGATNKEITSNISSTNPDGSSYMYSGKQKNDTITISFKKEGMRYGELTITDIAGNYTKLSIYANLDFTKPICKLSSVSNEGETSGITANLSCSDTVSSNLEKCAGKNATTSTHTGLKSTQTYNAYAMLEIKVMIVWLK